MSKNTDVAKIQATVDALTTTVSGKAEGGHNHDGVYEPADGTILKNADIGISVAAQHAHPYASDTHNHDGTYEPAFSKNTAFNDSYGTVAGTVCQGNDPRLSDNRDPNAHNHNASDINTGTINVARLGSGTPNGSKFLRDDNTWQTVSTTPTTTQVLNATAGASIGAVGTYAYAIHGSGIKNPGETAAGSALDWAGDYDGTFASPAQSGTWRCMGAGRDGFSSPSATLWLRIS